MFATRRLRKSRALRGFALTLGSLALITGCTPGASDAPYGAEPSQSAPQATPNAPVSPAPPAPATPAAPDAPDTPGAPDVPPPPAVDNELPPPALVDVARSALNELEIKGRAPKTGYARDQFGQRWSDDVSTEFGHNGCDTRNDILNRDLINKEYKPNTHDCVVVAGQLNDPYTGAVIQFQRGRDTSSAVQIDHVVALSDAWQKGAQQLPPEVRQDFANDPLNLLAVDGSANQQKRDSDAASWLPSNSPFRCQYVARQVAVKRKYQLWVTQAEHDAINRWLDTCTPEDDTALAALPLAN